jgi:hypothetical protein
MSGHPTSERAVTRQHPWWEVLSGELSREVDELFPHGIGSHPEPPLARKWVVDCVPFIFYVVRPYCFAYWYVWTDCPRFDASANVWETTRMKRVRRKFKTRENAVKAVDAEIRKLEQ